MAWSGPTPALGLEPGILVGSNTSVTVRLSVYLVCGGTGCLPSSALVQPQHKRRHGETDQAQRSGVGELLVRRERHLRDRVVPRRGGCGRGTLLVLGRGLVIEIPRLLLDSMVVLHVSGRAAAVCAAGFDVHGRMLGLVGWDCCRLAGAARWEVGHCSGRAGGEI